MHIGSVCLKELSNVFVELLIALRNISRKIWLISTMVGSYKLTDVLGFSFPLRYPLKKKLQGDRSGDRKDQGMLRNQTDQKFSEVQKKFNVIFEVLSRQIDSQKNIFFL